MPALLLHTCCAHCGAYPVEYWQGQGFTVTIFWYNPNIHPYQEHERRLEAVRSLVAARDVPLLASPGYDMPAYFRAVVGQEQDRCRYCFGLRLEHTARAAREGGFAAFSSTLLISPQQKHEAIREAGEEAGRSTGVPFLYHDLRKRYSDSRRITKPMEIYRQQYCGCIYSEWERYRPASS